MDETVVEVVLPNGATALVQAFDIDGGATKTAFGDRFDLDDISATLEGWSTAIKGAMSTASPSKVSVALALELVVKEGTLTGLLVKGGGKGSLSVTMEWTRDTAAAD